MRVFATEIGFQQNIALKEFEVYGQPVTALSQAQRAAILPMRIAVSKTLLTLRNPQPGLMKIAVWNAQGRMLWSHEQNVTSATPVLTSSICKKKYEDFPRRFFSLKGCNAWK